MKRAYYNKDTGMITFVVPERFAPNRSEPYILVGNNQNVNQYKINLSTQELELMPEQDIPQRRTR